LRFSAKAQLRAKYRDFTFRYIVWFFLADLLTESKVGKVLLIGVTGGTGGNVIKGFREQQLTNLRAITRKIDLNRPSLSKMSEVGVELVEANLDDENSLRLVRAGGLCLCSRDFQSSGLHEIILCRES
jgi:hypothetical protein